MQVARLIEPRRERSISAKLIQIARAIQIERRLSKTEILNLYLTHAPYGGNLEGVLDYYVLVDSLRRWYGRWLPAAANHQIQPLAVRPGRSLGSRGPWLMFSVACSQGRRAWLHIVLRRRGRSCASARGMMGYQTR